MCCAIFHDRFLEGVQIMLPIALTLAWLFSVAMTVRGVVKEKELRLKEVHSVLSLTQHVHICISKIDQIVSSVLRFVVA